mmetsp:Transcript_76005/g.191271  ORF Transcript_76005/g.191271 Transcript_76005/m.191271 type:complete len:396 (-) Transcript_76005:2443-3630(-)
MSEGHRHPQLLQRQPAALHALHEDVVVALPARRELADDQGLLVMLAKRLEHVRHILGRDDERHADAAVEGGDHLVARDTELPRDPTEHGRQLPLLRLQVRLQLLRQDAGDASLEATAGDRGCTLELARARQVNDGLRVDARWREEDLPEGPRGVKGRGDPVLNPRCLGQRAQQAEAVTVQPRGGQADDRIASAHPVLVRQRRRPLSDAHGEARDIEAAGAEDARHLCRLRAEQSAARLRASLGDALVDQHCLVRIQLRRGEVGHEEQRLGTPGRDVVSAESDEVSSHGVEALHDHRDLQLGAHAVRAAHQRGLLVVQGGDVAKSGQAMRAAVLLATLAQGLLHQRPDACANGLLHGEVDACAQVCLGVNGVARHHAASALCRLGQVCDVSAEEGA